MRQRFASVLVTGLCLLAGAAQANDGCCKPVGCGAAPGCGSYLLTCRAEVTLEPVKKTCWEVQCEHICIPPVRFPWQKCGEPLGCGKIRCVKKLKEVEYECGQECVYDWKVVNLGCVGGCKPDGWCSGDCGISSSPCTDADSIPPAANDYESETAPPPPAAADQNG